MNYYEELGAQSFWSRYKHQEVGPPVLSPDTGKRRFWRHFGSPGTGKHRLRRHLRFLTLGGLRFRSPKRSLCGIAF